MKIIRTAGWSLGCAALVALIGSCSGSDRSTTGLTDNHSLLSNGAPSLLECPSNTTVQATGTIGLLGGVIQAGGTLVSIPAGALLAPTNIVLTIPASNYMEIDVSVPGVEHFVFDKDIVVTLDYSRCSRSNIDKAPLQVWHIDSQSKTMLEQMPSTDVKLTHTVIFTTGHLSGYALAN